MYFYLIIHLKIESSLHKPPIQKSGHIINRRYEIITKCDSLLKSVLSLCASPPPASRPATAAPPSRPPGVRGPTPGPPPPLNPSPAFGAPPVPSRPPGQAAYAGDPNSSIMPLVPSRPARVPPALPPGIPRYDRHTHTHTHSMWWLLLGLLVKGCPVSSGFLVLFGESLVHDFLNAFIPCMFLPPLPISSSLFLQQKTSGCSPPTHCHTSVRALPAWLETSLCLHVYISLHRNHHFSWIFL